MEPEDRFELLFPFENGAGDVASHEFEHLRLQLETIKSATSNFAAENCIGNGGFGKVYKGELDIHSKGQSVVAFKRLDRVFGQGNP
ncbi:Concanavalin A-like lectin/glucanase, subgroup [Cynara cardunculus var. scolymus]|uniref:Concanavalin A-like lectin/glucanase, subgroup n=1 Tax=Cynara cardunculus var. scolymus TaxID=59895 RepID=A0A103XJ75_CYNCS|nr:Concanavalin A-like lectin/glucanase, subgroup [Cynara cardunculus var. scolymus]